MAEPPRATLRARRRLPLVWLVPIVAILAAGWLGYRAVLERGPLIAITLQNAEGLEVGKTKIKHRDIELGLVEAMQPSADLTSVTVQARMNRYAEAHLTTGTRFWVERPRLSAEGISGLGTLISGAFIEMEPGPGEPARNFVGLDDPPVVSADVPGSRYQLHADQPGGTGQFPWRQGRRGAGLSAVGRGWQRHGAGVRPRPA